MNQNMINLGNNRSVIREIFEYGKQRAKIVGADNIFDFSIGNPNVPAPVSVSQAMKELAEMDPVALHGYTSAQGAESVRQAMADDLNRRFGTSYGPGNFYMTCGAAASLSIVLKALTAAPTDEFIIIAPCFPEYKVFITRGAGATCVQIPAKQPDLQIDFAALSAAITENTQGIIINSPNNPSGVVYTEETIDQLAKLLCEKSREIGHPIYLISDEPYREVVYDCPVPFIAPKYENTLVCYSYSKSLSLPGERIGYILVPNSVDNFADTYAAICGAGRVLGYVCAPATYQLIVEKCVGQTSDLSVYRENRKILLENLRAYGYTCVEPDGAFYLFVKTPTENADEFCKRAMDYDLLLVPGEDFGAQGYMRISYCVKTDTIVRALPLFKKLAEEYHLI